MKKSLLLIVGIITLIFLIPNTIFAMDFDRTKRHYIDGHNEYRLNVLTQEKTKVSFILQDDGTLALVNRKSYDPILVFKPFTPNIYDAKYSACKVETKNPKKVLFEVIAEDDNGYNVGYWLVGEYKGKWVTYLSTDNLMKMGYTPNQAHVIRPSDTDGNYVLTIYGPNAPYEDAYTHEEVEPEPPQLRVQLFWDPKAQWFGMRSIKLRNSTTGYMVDYD